MRAPFFVFFTVLALCLSAVAASVPGANQNATYRELRDITIGAESISVANVVLKRDAGTFTFKQGSFSFLKPVNGKVTGAVFSGNGEFTLSPPIANEQRSLSILTKGESPMTETFNTLVLRFTDNTYEELKKAGTSGSGAGNALDALKDEQNNSRNKLKTNYDARILQDVLSNETGVLPRLHQGPTLQRKDAFLYRPTRR